MLLSRLKRLRVPAVFLFAVFLSASAPDPMPTVLAGGLSEKSDAGDIYKLHVDDRRLAQRTLNDLVDLLGGRARSMIMKGSRPKTIRLYVTLPPDQSAYFLSKLSGLGELTAPSTDLNREGGPGDRSDRLISIDIFDR
ncbi:MAG: hypothetical protein HY283_11655 [Nitrospirae bacterium]|nr:hypothetical protein [Nitrospirota bacterium]